MWKLEHTVRGAARGWELTVNFDGKEIVCDGTKLDAQVLAYETTIHKARDQITQLQYYSKNFPVLSVSASQIPWALDDGTGTMLPAMQSDITLSHENDSTALFGVNKRRMQHKI